MPKLTDQKEITGLAPLPHAINTTCRAWLEWHHERQPFKPQSRTKTAKLSFETRHGVAVMADELQRRGVLTRGMADVFLTLYFSAKDESPGSARLSLRIGLCEAAAHAVTRAGLLKRLARAYKTCEDALTGLERELESTASACKEIMDDDARAAHGSLKVAVLNALSYAESLAETTYERAERRATAARAARHNVAQPLPEKKPPRKTSPDLV